MPLPDPDQQPYHVAVDNDHDVWTNMWTTDRIMPTTRPPTNGRYSICRPAAPRRAISRCSKGRQVEVVMPYSRTNKIAVMSFRSEADIAAAKQQAEQ